MNINYITICDISCTSSSNSSSSGGSISSISRSSLISSSGSTKKRLVYPCLIIYSIVYLSIHTCFYETNILMSTISGLNQITLTINVKKD